MASDIDTTQPPEGNPTTAGVRANFTSAKSEIEALQARISTLSVRVWIQRSSAADNNWTSVAWAPELGLFVAVANTGTGDRVMSSPDGINWTSRSSAADNNWQSVAWSPELGLFVAVAITGTGDRVMTNLL
jgi:hypothetical protein